MMRFLKPLLVSLAVLAPAAVGYPVAAQSRSATYDRIVATYDVQPDGRVHVLEEQTVDFRGGPFTQGFAELDLRGATDIVVTAVGEVGPDIPYQPGREAPYTYEVERAGGAVTVRWWFPPTADAKRRFVLSYQVEGALRFYEQGDQFWWVAIRPDQPDTREAVVTVALPDTVPAVELARGYRLPDGKELAMEPVDARTARLKVADVARGESVEVRVQWPHGLVLGTPAPFQAALDRERSGEQAQIDAATSPARVLLSLLLAVLSLLILLGGAFGLFLLWHTRGRDTPASLPADYLAEPPSDLAPGLAGTLLDESADLRDVLATVVDLCRRGELRMVEEVEEGFLGLAGRRDFRFHHTPTGAALAPFEAAVLAALLDGKSSRRMSQMRNSFYQELPALQTRFYEGVVTAGLFDESPETVRDRYRWLGCGGVILTVLLTLVAALLGGWMPALWLLPVVLGLLSLGAFLASQFMPRKSAAGAEAAARWAAFRNYLANIDRYRDLQEAQDVFDRYLPYAVAFDLDEEWIRRFAAVGAEGPPWFEPAPVPGGGSWWPRGGTRRGMGVPGPGLPGGDGPGGDLGVPDLQRASAGLGRSLQGMSASLAAMLNTASMVMQSQPSSQGSSGWSGGGWSGGGFSGGGGGGGGGGGFG